MTGDSALVLTADRVLAPDGVLEPGWVALAGDRILGLGQGAPPEAARVERLDSLTLAPGYVDVHQHGGGGESYGAGPEAARQVLATHRTHGTTSAIASLVSEDAETLTRQVRDLAPLVSSGDLLGLHLEGPWLAPQHRGAHDPTVLGDPLWPVVEGVLAAGDGAVRMITLAPELPGAIDTIERLSALGVVAAIGHTAATYDQTRAAIDAGASVATHLFNAMPAIHHRAPGPVPALLGHDEVFIELIADGVHLHPAVLRVAASAAAGRTVLVTDAMAAAGAPDGDYQLGPMTVQVSDGVARLVDTGSIAGSTLTLDAAVRYAVQYAGLAWEDAVRAATQTPAAMVGADDVGALVPGRRADLVALDADLAVHRVMRAGEWLAAER